MELKQFRFSGRTFYRARTDKEKFFIPYRNISEIFSSSTESEAFQFHFGNFNVKLIHFRFFFFLILGKPISKSFCCFFTGNRSLIILRLVVIQYSEEENMRTRNHMRNFIFIHCKRNRISKKFNVIKTTSTEFKVDLWSCLAIANTF